MKVKTTVHIYHSQYSWEKAPKFHVYSIKIDDTEHMTYVGERNIEIEVPDGYDPRAQKVAALEKQKQKVIADYHKTLMEINESISKLQAIEFTA